MMSSPLVWLRLTKVCGFKKIFSRFFSWVFFTPTLNVSPDSTTCSSFEPDSDPLPEPNFSFDLLAGSALLEPGLDSVTSDLWLILVTFFLLVSFTLLSLLVPTEKLSAMFELFNIEISELEVTFSASKVKLAVVFEGISTKEFSCSLLFARNELFVFTDNKYLFVLLSMLIPMAAVLALPLFCMPSLLYIVSNIFFSLLSWRSWPSSSRLARPKSKLSFLIFSFGSTIKPAFSNKIPSEWSGRAKSNSRNSPVSPDSESSPLSPLPFISNVFLVLVVSPVLNSSSLLIKSDFCFCRDSSFASPLPDSPLPETWEISFLTNVLLESLSLPFPNSPEPEPSDSDLL